MTHGQCISVPSCRKLLPIRRRIKSVHSELPARPNGDVGDCRTQMMIFRNVWPLCGRIENKVFFVGMFILVMMSTIRSPSSWDAGDDRADDQRTRDSYQY